MLRVGCEPESGAVAIDAQEIDTDPQRFATEINWFLSQCPLKPR